MNLKSSNSIKSKSFAIRRKIIETAYKCGESCHLGGSLSMVDLLAVLYYSDPALNPFGPESNSRNIFLLSKGHCVLGYYSTLNVFGYMDNEVLDTFQTNGSHLIAHPVKNLELGIESSNGSLGQGLSFGLGISLGMRLDQMLKRRVYVLMGDGECNEGSVWETAASAAEFRANNLTAIVDANSLRNDGENSTYSGRIDFKNIWQAFGWNVVDIDGHDFDQIQNGFEIAKSCTDKPTVILARTIKGKGVSFMEANNDWHHNRITAKTYDQIVNEWAELND
ncbi:transketolase [Alphaproteobacteria bacterium]|nr:transketolase [Alphaproteobacteria bacterium]